MLGEPPVVILNDAGALSMVPIPDLISLDQFRRYQRRIAKAMQAVKEAVGAHFPETLDPLRAALGVIGVGTLSDNRQPTTLVLVGPSSAGKTLALSLLMPEAEGHPLWAYLHRLDKFTTAAFITHRADMKVLQLKKLDLLPQLRNKTLITKELAPTFNGKDYELRERFATLATVLDGQGLVSHSGAQGRRGLIEPINFQWLGATTPLSAELIDVMALIGPRILFYSADRPAKTTDELVALLDGGGVDRVATCRALVLNLLEFMLSFYGAGSVPGTLVELAETHKRYLALWGQALAALRATVHGNDRDHVTVEHPERTIGILRNFVIGSAIVHGRLAVDDYDLAQVAHIALSSGIATRAAVFRGLLDAGGTASTKQLETATGKTTKTVLRHLADLAAVRLVSVQTGEGSRPSRATIAPNYRDLAGAPRHRPQRCVERKGVEGGHDSV